jgi:hypothetical protein
MITILKKGSDTKEIEKSLSRLKNKKSFDSQKYCGVLKIKKDPIVVQKSMRNEWE